MFLHNDEMWKRDIIQSAGGVVYYIDKEDWEPRYLLIKRQAMSKKIEWVCPKWKLENNETLEQAALREVYEETRLSINHLKIITELWQTHIRSTPHAWNMNKDITLFLMHYTGAPDAVKISDGEGYVGIYKWCTLQEVRNLIYYPDLRELIRGSYDLIKDRNVKKSIKDQFMEKL